MKASGIITVVGSVGALALLGFTLLRDPGSPEGVTQPSAPASRTGSPEGVTQPAGSAHRASANTPTLQGGEVRPMAAPSAAQASASRQAPGAQLAAPLPSAKAPVPSEVPSAAAASPSSASTNNARDSRIQEMLDLARQAPTEVERLQALRWLEERAGPPEFEALQDIQINDSSSEVRKAAETAVNVLRERHAHSEWPGVPQGLNPQDYMRGVRPPP